MTGITEFLNARLDEDEATARYSGPALIAWLTFRDGDGQMLYTTPAASDAGDQGIWAADGRELPEPASARVVYDPARILREVEAKRAILAEHQPVVAGLQSVTGEGCRTCDETGVGVVSPGWPCATVRALASVFSDHADYDPAWKVS
jgi:hypothetical protein